MLWQVSPNFSEYALMVLPDRCRYPSTGWQLPINPRIFTAVNNTNEAGLTRIIFEQGFWKLKLQKWEYYF
jgi:hypothetical protein